MFNKKSRSKKSAPKTHSAILNATASARERTTTSHSAIVSEKPTNKDNDTQSKNKKQGKGVLNNGSLVGNFLNAHVLHRRANNPAADSATDSDVDDVDSEFQNSTLKLLRYKGLTHDRGHYLVLSDSFSETVGFAEILRIGGEGLSDLPDQLMEQVVSRFINFLRVDLVEYTFVSLPLPNDSKIQQHQWNARLLAVQDALLHDEDHKLSERKRAQLIAQRNYIREIINQFQTVDLTLINQGFVMFIFGKTIKEVRANAGLTMRFGESALKLSKMSVDEKTELLHRLNNPLAVQ